MALRPPLNFSPTSYAAAASSSSKELSNSIRLGRRRHTGGILSAEFCDQGHVQYYKSVFGSTEAAGKEMSAISDKEVRTGKDKSPKKMMKKRLKLLKGLSRDISTFSQMGFGLDSDGALVDQIKSNMITEATQVLLEQLEKVKAEEKEAKRRMKEEKARSKAAARMQRGKMASTSSSSSSESSDSECGEVVDMSSLKQTKPGLEKEESPAFAAPIIPKIPSIEAEEVVLQVEKAVDSSGSCSVSPACSKKIEVCMGSKCKKSGAGVLLEEFERVVGVEGAVGGCKCMGKCRDGPNVKIVDGVGKNSLCIGVGLEDVNAIVANFIGQHSTTNQQQQQQLGFAAAT